jgi:hypothetical protein
MGWMQVLLVGSGGLSIGQVTGAIRRLAVYN